jgi:pimeloyl-ACP methyl ester carboxylesterase
MSATAPTANRTDVAFDSQGTRCRAWLYRPIQAASPSPCVVMAHGFGATRDASLEPYAAGFAAAGMAALVFDYRHFGASDGEPRQLVAAGRQLQDYSAAIACARTLDAIDASRVAVWGTSFAGGHALVTAARVPGLAAAVCQCPLMDGLAAVRRIASYAGIGQLLRLTAHGLVDLAMAPFGGAHYIPIVGHPGELAMMTSPDAYDGYRALVPPGFRFEVAARIALSAGFYRPVGEAARAQCPVLVQICTKDSVAPVPAAEEAVRRLGARGEVRRYDIGHFEPYFGAHFERSLADQVEFLTRHFRLEQPAA